MTTITANQHIANEFTSIVPSAPSKAQRITGRVLSGFSATFLFVDAIAKLLMLKEVLEGSAKVGFNDPDVIFGLGVTLFVSTLLYAIPRTAVLGAVLLTGYMGGAICTHVRLADPLFSHTLFPLYVAAMFWGGLFLRDARLRAFLPGATCSKPRPSTAPIDHTQEPRSCPSRASTRISTSAAALRKPSSYTSAR